MGLLDRKIVVDNVTVGLIRVKIKGDSRQALKWDPVLVEKVLGKKYLNRLYRDLNQGAIKRVSIDVANSIKFNDEKKERESKMIKGEN